MKIRKQIKMENLLDIKNKILHFCENKFIIFYLENSKNEEILTDFENNARDKLNISEGFEWSNDDFIKFIQVAEKSEVKIVYMCAPEISEEDVIEPEEFKSENILSKHIGEVPFLLFGFYLNNKFHYIDLSTDWFNEISRLCETGSSENKIEEDNGDEWEDLTEEDKENYGRKIAQHPDFSKFLKNYTIRKMFIRRYFPEIYKEVDECGLNEIIDMARFIYETDIKNGNLSKV